MTVEQLLIKIRQWDLQNTGSPDGGSYYSEIYNELEYHASKEWRLYLPAQHPSIKANYLERLAAWIGNVTDENDQKLLLEYARIISFFSHDDFAALYRTALDREVSRWIAELAGLRLEGANGAGFNSELSKQIHQHTWFCPITDSMDINEFYKVNHIKGVGHRPAFASIQLLAERLPPRDANLASKLITYMDNPSLRSSRPHPPLTRLVLLEDIVGSGSQCNKAVRWAVEHLKKPVLFVPLILCPNGVDLLRALESRYAGRLAVRPIIELSRSDLLGPESQGQTSWPFASELEALANRCLDESRVHGCPFGYRNTGCSLTTFANCPNNTLPIVHVSRPGQWNALYPRVYREV